MKESIVKIGSKAFSDSASAIALPKASLWSECHDCDADGTSLPYNKCGQIGAYIMQPTGDMIQRWLLLIGFHHSKQPLRNVVRPLRIRRLECGKDKSLQRRKV